MPKVAKVKPSHVHLNLTAMLDVVFNLIFFFICIANLAGNELPDLDVPHPERSTAKDNVERHKVTINIVPEKGGNLAKEIKVGADSMNPAEMPRITELIAKEVALNPAIEIDLRVDKKIKYREVRPVMNAITKAGVGRINLVAHADEKGK